MGASYAGDRLQQLAQAWLVATLTHSALGVGLISAFGSLAQLLMPLGGVVADQVDRRRLVLTGQFLGGAAATVLAALVLTGHVVFWYIYIWAFVSGLVWLISRPAYKVLLTNAVPREEVQSAVAINAMTETAEGTLVNAGGSLLLAAVGLPVAFVLNAVSYFVAAFTVGKLPGLDPPATAKPALAPGQIFGDLREGLRYLRSQPALLYPMLISWATAVCAAPALSLLAAIVRRGGGTVVAYGMLAASVGVGSFLGAAYAGSHADGAQRLRQYAQLTVLAAVALVLFVVFPLGAASVLPLAAIGFTYFCESVWNKSRVRHLAPDAYQGRLQSLVTMTATLGFPIGALWGGAAVDRFGVHALLGGAVALAVLAAATIVVGERMCRSAAAGVA
jgi:MFS family permease